MAALPEVNRYHPFSLIDRDGNFNENIGKDLDLANENCVAVSIIGVQSSGKSTLLNKCFSTKFEEMDESQGMSQTTKGIWIAKAPSSNDGPKILVIDTEGSDSSERRREGDDSFERKMTAFALASSNTVIVNMECKNVGRHDGASRPLLQAIFQVMLDKFTTTPRKVNLMFVLRDKNQSPLDKLEKQLREGLDEIWRGISTKAELKDYFNVVMMTMSHYVLQREEFDKEVKGVRDRLSSLAKDGPRCRASAFLDLAKRNWNDIMENKILNLNLNKVTIDKVLCLDINEKTFENFLQDEDWLHTKTAVESGTMVQDFGKLVNSIVIKYLSQYDEETLYTDESTRNHYRNLLTENLSQVVEPSYLDLVAKMREETLEEFLKEIVKEIESRGNFENINSDKFFQEFRVRLGDALVELASWNHTSSQLEKMQSELDSYKEDARRVMEKLTTLEETDVTMLVNTMNALGCGDALGAAIVAPHIAGVVAIAPLGLGVAFSLPTLSIVSIVQAFIKHVETKKQMDKEREERVVDKEREERVSKQIWQQKEKEVSNESNDMPKYNVPSHGLNLVKGPATAAPGIISTIAVHTANSSILGVCGNVPETNTDTPSSSRPLGNTVCLVRTPLDLTAMISPDLPAGEMNQAQEPILSSSDEKEPVPKAVGTVCLQAEDSAIQLVSPELTPTEPALRIDEHVADQGTNVVTQHIDPVASAQSHSALDPNATELIFVGSSARVVSPVALAPSPVTLEKAALVDSSVNSLLATTVLETRLIGSTSRHAQPSDDEPPPNMFSSLPNSNGPSEVEQPLVEQPNLEPMVIPRIQNDQQRKTHQEQITTVLRAAKEQSIPFGDKSHEQSDATVCGGHDDTAHACMLAKPSNVLVGSLPNLVEQPVRVGTEEDPNYNPRMDAIESSQPACKKAPMDTRRKMRNRRRKSVNEKS